MHFFDSVHLLKFCIVYFSSVTSLFYKSGSTHGIHGYRTLIGSPGFCARLTHPRSYKTEGAIGQIRVWFTRLPSSYIYIQTDMHRSHADMPRHLVKWWSSWHRSISIVCTLKTCQTVRRLSRASSLGTEGIVPRWHNPHKVRN